MPTPSTEQADVCVDSNQDVIRKFCELESKVWHSVIEPINPRDCFCGHGQRMSVAPVLKFEDGYRHNLAAFRFIEAAAMKSVEEFQAMKARHEAEAQAFSDPPASPPASEGRELDLGKWLSEWLWKFDRKEIYDGPLIPEIKRLMRVMLESFVAGHPAAPAGERGEVERRDIESAIRYVSEPLAAMVATHKHVGGTLQAVNARLREMINAGLGAKASIDARLAELEAENASLQSRLAAVGKLVDACSQLVALPNWDNRVYWKDIHAAMCKVKDELEAAMKEQPQ